MFVRDEDPIQTLWTNSDRCQSLGDLSGAESGVHQKTALVRSNQRTIACTAAPEDRHTEHAANRAQSPTDANQITEEPVGMALSYDGFRIFNTSKPKGGLGLKGSGKLA